MSPPRLLLATANEGKIRELRGMLTGVELVGLRDVGITDLDEPSDDFVTNALAKALEASRRAGLPALADDSGLAVDALGGAPGVFSARYAGRHGDDRANRALLLERLAGVPVGLRGARFRCVVALADVGGPLGQRGMWVHGSCEGSIATREQGTGGFGYDPLFIVGGGSLTMAELPPDVKDRVSHRGRAVRAALPLVLAYLDARRIGDGRSTWGSLPP
jgi:XTP/dITP diphosphohydrolase